MNFPFILFRGCTIGLDVDDALLTAEDQQAIVEEFKYWVSCPAE